MTDVANFPQASLAVQLAELRREKKMRAGVYPHNVLRAAWPIAWQPFPEPATAKDAQSSTERGEANTSLTPSRETGR